MTTADDLLGVDVMEPHGDPVVEHARRLTLATMAVKWAVSAILWTAVGVEFWTVGAGHLPPWARLFVAWALATAATRPAAQLALFGVPALYGLARGEVPKLAGRADRVKVSTAAHFVAALMVALAWAAS